MSGSCSQFLQLKLKENEKALIAETLEFLEEAALSQPKVAVHRDYHSRNLMILGTKEFGENSTPGIIDFQDAVIGSPAYDLMSLLEDARRDIRPESVESMLLHYLTSMPDTHPDLFMNSYQILGLQRHCKVAGIFTRLATRDAKPAYREHLPRVLTLISLKLSHPLVMPVREWFDQHLPEIPNREPMA